MHDQRLTLSHPAHRNYNRTRLDQRQDPPRFQVLNASKLVISLPMMNSLRSCSNYSTGICLTRRINARHSGNLVNRQYDVIATLRSLYDGCYHVEPAGRVTLHHKFFK
ncbi:hypothetical protein ANTQUA_LOCUS1293 [Anthophora quadrimaculata]